MEIHHCMAVSLLILKLKIWLEEFKKEVDHEALFFFAFWLQTFLNFERKKHGSYIIFVFFCEQTP